MRKINAILLMFIITFTAINFVSAIGEDNEIQIDNNLIVKDDSKKILEDIKFKNNINIEEKLEIDLSTLEKNLTEENNNKVLFEWNITGEKTQNGSKFEKKFETFGEKEISLNIYKINGINRELISNQKINIFVYKTKITAIFEKTLQEKLEDFIAKSKESGVYIDKNILEQSEIEKFNFSENIISNLEEDNYIILWGNKNFMFDILSKINTENIKEKINIVGISGFNINLLQKFLQNVISNKIWINKGLLLDESSKFEILKQSENINKLEEEIIKNNYEYINLNSKSQINEVLFISKFINNLSNSGFSLNNIYLILIIPFLLLGVSIFKHLIGLTPTGMLIPITITLLLIKLGILPTFLLILIFFITNVLLSKAVAKYSLHYTPKISMLTIINIIIFIITINIFIVYNLIKIDINDIIFIILFILISEKLINIMVSKEFGEYKGTLINTILFSLIAYGFFSLTLTKTFILAYPEIILLLIPIAFIIGKFTGLRVTEYFRFKEVIKSIEE